MGRHEKTIRFRAVGIAPISELLSTVSDWGARNVRPYVLRHLGVEPS